MMFHILDVIKDHFDMVRDRNHGMKLQRPYAQHQSPETHLGSKRMHLHSSEEGGTKTHPTSQMGLLPPNTTHPRIPGYLDKKKQAMHLGGLTITYMPG